MNKSSRVNPLLLLIIVVVIINAFLLVRLYIKTNKTKENKATEEAPPLQIVESEFYNKPCPEIIKPSISGAQINIHNYVGNVTIIRFSRFYRQDLPRLVYLEELAEKYCDNGLRLIFINTRGKHDVEGINKIVAINCPVIEDDGTVTGLFNAYPEDTIILDRSLKIRFKSDKATKSLIYDEVTKWLFDDLKISGSIPSERIEQNISNLEYYDIANDHISKIKDVEGEKIVTLSTSLCTGCEETGRLLFLKELTKTIGPNKVKIILLFGKLNNPKAIHEYVYLQGWKNLPIIVGIVNAKLIFNRNIYYELFPLDADPVTYLLSPEGRLQFQETRRNIKIVQDKIAKIIK
jgi:hypothetical protein